jgi:hypothetical protein
MNTSPFHECLYDWFGLQKKDIIILLVLTGISFLVSFGVTSPAILMNDEWITLNQLYQISQHTQIIFNEGKYGTHFTGETDSYFVAKNNYLAYSLFLPVISIPALSIISLAGDSFRLLFLCLWAFIGYGTLFLAGILWNENRKYRLFLIISFLIFTLFFLNNLLLYRPFLAEGPKRPIETAAVIITGNILYSAMTPLLYIIYLQCIHNRNVSIIASFITMCCSSYLIWAGSAKDHLLVAFLVTCIFLVSSVVIRKYSNKKIFFLFFLCGLLCWARTEYGVMILLGLWAWHMWMHTWNKKMFPRRSIRAIQAAFPAIIGTICGLLPYFYNNYLTTSNPLIPPQYIYIATRDRLAGDGSQIISTVADSHGLNAVFSFIGKAISFYMPDSLDISDVYGIFIQPQNGGVGILFIVPIIIPAILYFLINRKGLWSCFDDKTRKMIVFTILFIIITFFAYLRVLHGSNVSFGVLPDMRYFSSLYIPLNILSLILLSPVLISERNLYLKFFAAVVVLFPLFYIIIIFLLSPGGADYNDFMDPLKKILLVELVIASICAFGYNKISHMKIIFPYLCIILAIIPFTFQIIETVITGHLKPNGYTFWLPFLENIFSTYFISI